VVTYHLAQNAAVALQGSVVYPRSRDIDAVRWPELIRAYVVQHGSINNTECRQLLGLGNSDSARTQATRLLQAMDFLETYGSTRQNTRYRLRQSLGA
jgi:ATP-dependent DNA helicase RecG